MDKIVYKLVYNRKKHFNQRGLALVQVEAYLHGKRSYFSTNVYLKPNQWDVKRQLVCRHTNAESLNRLLYDYLNTLESKELELWKQNKPISLELLKSIINEKLCKQSFYDFYFREACDAAVKESTRINHLTTFNLLKQFSHNMTFDELSYESVASFEHFLLQKGYHINTVAKHLKQLKRYINVAIYKGYIDSRNYPFRNFKIKSVESKHIHLSIEELAKLEALVLDKRHCHYRHTLDAFLFCCYSGMRYSDFTSLTADNVIIKEQNLWLVYRSIKTRIEVRLPLYLLFDGKAIHILQRHEANLTSFFHLKNNSNVNKELAVIGRMAGIHRHFSFHSARHTYATLLIYKGANITTVQKLLGHSNIQTTQLYAHIMDVTVLSDLQRILGRKEIHSSYLVSQNSE